MATYLHIGSPKCGSTTLQRLIVENSSTLSEHNVWTPGDESFAHKLGHHWVGGGWMGDVPPVQLPHIDSSRDLLLSSEVFLRIASSPEKLDSFMMAFSNHEPIHALGIIRNPADLLESTFFQWIRTCHKFPNVAKAIRNNGFDYKAFLEKDWFESIDANWRRWKNHPKIKSFTCIRLGIDTFNPASVISQFIGRSVPLKAESNQDNKSINGATFRILIEWQNAKFSSYEKFVPKLDAAMQRLGYGDYRYFSPEMFSAINRKAGSLPLFANYSGLERERRGAVDIDASTFAKLLSLSKDIAQPFLA